MRKATKGWLIAAASLVVIGVVVIIAVSAFHWEFTDLSTEKYETNTYEIREEFRNITINTDTADILFAASKDNICTVVCYEEENEKHSVSVQNGTLTINILDDRAWYEYIGINLHSPKVTVYLPESEYASLTVRESTGNVEISKGLMYETVDIMLSTGDVNLFASVSESVKINASTGHIRVDDITAGTLNLTTTTGEISVSDVICEGDIRIDVTTGAVKLANVACQNLLSTGSTSDISLKNLLAAESISVKRSTGGVSFDRSDAAEILVKTDTGDVYGSLLTEKFFITETSTGRIDVPKTITGGKCEITTSTGNIEIKIAE